MDSIDQIDSFEQIDIKTSNISKKDLERAAKSAGSFEAVFSKRAMKYRSLGLNNKQLTEEDYKSLILEEYTFLKRPVFFVDDKVFVGNTKSTIQALQDALNA